MSSSAVVLRIELHNDTTQLGIWWVTLNGESYERSSDGKLMRFDKFEDIFNLNYYGLTNLEHNAKHGVKP